MTNIHNERITQEKIQKLIKRVKELGYNESVMYKAKKLVEELQKRDVYCVDKFVCRLISSSNKEEYLDILREGRFAIILSKHKFSEIHIEYSKKGPDVKARWNGKTIYFEVTRRHPGEDDKAMAAGVGIVKKLDSPESIVTKVNEKLKQLESGETNIIVLWSDSWRRWEANVQEAFKCIKHKINNDPQKYKDMSGILFTEGGAVSFCLFENEKATKQLGTRLAKELKSLSSKNPKQLQEEIESMAKSLMQMMKKEEVNKNGDT